MAIATIFHTTIMELQFKTSINCNNCIKSVQGFLDDISNIEWTVDTEHPDKILSVKGDNLNTEEIIAAVDNAGFEIQLI